MARSDQALRTLGYVRFGDATRKTATKFDAILQTLTVNKDYEFTTEAGVVWGRFVPGSSGAVRLQRPVVRAHAGDTQRLRIDALQAIFQEGIYGQHVDRSGRMLSFDQAMKYVAAAKKSKRFDKAAWYDVSGALSLAHPSILSQLVHDKILPLLFKWNRKAVLHAFAVDNDLERRFGQIRSIRVASEYDILVFASGNPSGLPEVPESLTAWQSTAPTGFFAGLLDWASLLTFPYINAYSCGWLGICFSYVADEMDKYKPGIYPQTQLSLKRSHAFFGTQQSAKKIANGMLHISFDSLHSKYCWTKDRSHSESLILWIAERSAILLGGLSNLTTYERASLGPGVDFVLAQEQMWTIDRILRRTIQIQSAEAGWSTRTHLFEIADMWSELMKQWKGNHEGEWFRSLFRPKTSARHVIECLRLLPQPWRARFSEVANEIYAELENCIKQSVWSTKMKSAAGVLLPDGKGATKIDAWEEFIPSVIRDLRNTHHGYSPDPKKAPKPRSRMILTTGDLPESTSFLPSLWLLAFLSDPAKFLGWKPE